jgi:hypothetical protein
MADINPKHSVEYCYMLLEPVTIKPPQWQGDKLHVVDINLTDKTRPLATTEAGLVFLISHGWIPDGPEELSFRLCGASHSFRDTMPFQPRSARLLTEKEVETGILAEDEEDYWMQYYGFRT